MAAYPNFGQAIGSDEEWIDDLVTDRAVGGGVKSRSFYPAKKRKFTVRHILSAADRATLQAFYDTNRTETVTFTWTGDGVTYTCLFDGSPKIRQLGANRTQVDVQLLEQ